MGLYSQILVEEKIFIFHNKMVGTSELFKNKLFYPVMLLQGSNKKKKQQPKIPRQVMLTIKWQMPLRCFFPVFSSKKKQNYRSTTDSEMTHQLADLNYLVKTFNNARNTQQQVMNLCSATFESLSYMT